MRNPSTAIHTPSCTYGLMISPDGEHTIGMEQIHLNTPLELTSDMAGAYIDARLDARRLLREDRQRAARKGVETKRKAH